jgi:hypothetical protein
VSLLRNTQQPQPKGLPEVKNPKAKNWQNGNQQVNPGAGDEWARVKKFKDPVTGKTMSDFEMSIGSAPKANSSLGRQGKGLVGNEDGSA